MNVIYIHNQELSGVAYTLDDMENERVRITANKGVTIRASNTYYVMPTRYGYRVTTMDNVEGLKKIAEGFALECYTRNFDGALVMKTEEMNSVVKFIQNAEGILH